MSLLKSLKGLYKGWDGELTVKLIHWCILDKAVSINKGIISDSALRGE